MKGDVPGHEEAPNCYACKWRRPCAGDSHSSCVHPEIGDEVGAMEAMVQPYMVAMGLSTYENFIENSPWSRLGISAREHGIRSGWFTWPLNFDPVWLLTCDGFEAKDAERDAGQDDGDG